MSRMYGMDPDGNWDIDTPEGMMRAKEWLERHLEFIRDGGTWVVPRSWSIIQIHHAEKRAKLVSQLDADPSLRRVFEALGWTWEGIE